MNNDLYKKLKTFAHSLGFAFSNNVVLFNITKKEHFSKTIGDSRELCEIFNLKYQCSYYFNDKDFFFVIGKKNKVIYTETFYSGITRKCFTPKRQDDTVVGFKIKPLFFFLYNKGFNKTRKFCRNQINELITNK